MRADRMPLLQNRVSASLGEIATSSEAKLLLMFFAISCAALAVAWTGMRVVVTQAIEDEARIAGASGPSRNQCSCPVRIFAATQAKGIGRSSIRSGIPRRSNVF